MTNPTGALELVTNTNSLENPHNWGPMLDLPCEVVLDLPVPSFTVADLIRLNKDAVLDTGWANGDDVPVRVNGTLIAWAEFEVVDDRLAVRITEWA